MPPMHADRWSVELDAANSETEVMYIARDYSAMLSRAEVARLPEHCRPPMLRDADDLSSWGIELLRAKLAICADTDAVPLILAVEGFLSAAMHRLAEIESRMQDGPPHEADPRHLDS
jgi:hypothetical protein